METVLTTDCLQVHIHPSPVVQELEWLDFVSGTEFQEGILAALALGRQYDVRGWISNHRRMRAIRAADQDWYETEAAPQFLTLPRLACVALVTSDNAMNRMAVSDLGSRQPPAAALPFVYTEVESVAAARAWVWAQLAPTTNAPLA